MRSYLMASCFIERNPFLVPCGHAEDANHEGQQTGGWPLSGALDRICPSGRASAVVGDRCDERVGPLVTDRVARSNHLGVEYRSRGSAFRYPGGLSLGHRPSLCANATHPSTSTEASAA